MANDVKWIKMMVGMFDGMSFKKIKRAKIGGESFRDKLTAIWFELLDFAGRCNHGGAFIGPCEIPFTDLADIATMIDRDEEELRLCMSFYIKEGMVTIIDDVYCLTNWAEYQNKEGLDKIREQTRIRVARHRENKKLLIGNVTGNVTVTDGNALDIDKELDIDLYNNTNSASDNAPCTPDEVQTLTQADVQKVLKYEVNEFFESVWKLYPKKKGKDRISDSKKKKLYKIGYDELSRAISRYVSDLKKEPWRQAQNGSTFFNSGYVDYLDCNYISEEEGSGSAISANNDQNDLDDLF